MKKLSFLVVGILILSGFGAVAINVTETQNQQIDLYKISDMFTYQYPNDHEIDISFDMQDLIEDQITNEYGTFKIFNIPNQGFIGSLGKPQLPVVNLLIAVPTNEVSLEIINTNIAQETSVGKVYPAQMPQTDSGGSQDFIIDEEFYQQDIVYPGILCEKVNDGNIRDITFVKIELYPVQYNPAQELAIVYDEITIELSWNAGETVEVESNFENAPFNSYYKNVFSNWQGFIENTDIVEEQNDYREEGCDIIVISHPDFYDETQALADWKNAKGYKTLFVDTSISGTTSSAIKNYIKNAYDTMDPRPSYFLLVGDAEDIPTSSYNTDLYYATTDGSDYFPDMFYGRIPVDTTSEIETIVDKILTYEQSPPTESSFYKNFAVAAYFQDDEGNGYETRRFVRTSEEIRDYLMTLDYIGERIYVTEPYINPTHYNNGYYGNGEPLPDELLRPTFPWDGEADDIINAVETGVFILNHRDHGGEEAWGDPYFDVNHIATLTNGELLPVVFSINCLTGKFYNMECFAERFLRKDGGGAVAVFAASEVSYSGYNDFLCRGFYDAMWPEFDPEVGTSDPMYTLGELLNYGKVYMTETWGDPWGEEDYTFELFHVFGDPTMEIWSKEPANLDVSYSFSGEDLEVTVEGESGLLEGALVCLSQQSSGFYVKGYTDSGGSIIIDTAGADILEEVSLAVSYHNYLTYQETFLLNQMPEIPEKPNGPTSGKVNIEYTFTASTTDPDDDKLYYQWRWGDGSESEWLGPYNSGETCSAVNKWSDTATYGIRVKVKDINGQETDYSEKLYFSVTKARSRNIFLQSFLQQYPIIYDILVKLFNL